MQAVPLVVIGVLLGFAITDKLRVCAPQSSGCRAGHVLLGLSFRACVSHD
jgi:hypothetical protein